jgi:hypothetical protein
MTLCTALFTKMTLYTNMALGISLIQYHANDLDEDEIDELLEVSQRL